MPQILFSQGQGLTFLSALTGSEVCRLIMNTDLPYDILHSTIPAPQKPKLDLN